MPAEPVSDVKTAYLTFHLKEEEFAVPVLRVREIIEQQPLTALPGAPPAVRGVLNLRGAVVPVLDLSVRFGFPPTASTDTTCVVIVEIETDGELALFGLLTDSVRRVVDLAAAEIEPPPPFGTGVRSEYLAGLGKTPDSRKFLMILDIDKVLEVEGGRRAQEAARDLPAPPPPSGAH